MKLYVINQRNSSKIYLDYEADSRKELSHKIGGNQFYVNNKEYSIEDVFAEAETLKIFPGLAAGATIGTAFGPTGSIVGGILGGVLGSMFGLGGGSNKFRRMSMYNDEMLRVKFFNESKVRDSV